MGMLSRILLLLLVFAAPAFAQEETLFDQLRATGAVTFPGLASKTIETECVWIDAAGHLAHGSCATGTVTSVALSLPNIFTVTGSPVTTSGTLTATFASQTAYSVFARGASAGVPSFQSLVDLHIPDALTLTTVSGTPNFTGAVTMGSTLGVTGAGTFGSLVTGNLDLQGTLSDSTGNVTIGDNVDLTGTLAVTGATTLSSTLDVRGAVSDGGGNLVLDDAVDISGVTSHSNTTQSSGWASKTSGWGITSAGDADFRGMFADELRVKLFTTELSQALNGSLIVSKSVAEVSQVFTCPALGATATLWVHDFPTTANVRVFMANDKVQLRTMSWSDPDTDGGAVLTVSDCVGTVSAYADGTAGNEGQQSWTFTRGTSASGGTMAASTVIPVGTQVLNFGVANDGFVEIVANDGADNVNAPYVGIVTWGGAGPIAANRTTRARLGNLRGITSTDEYGVIAGSYAASNGAFFRASDQNFDLHNITLKLWDGSTNVISLVPGSAPYFSLGNPAPTTYASGTGVWMGDDSGTYKFRVGNPAGSRLTWDGTTLAVVGVDGAGITNIDGGNIQTGTVTAGKLEANLVIGTNIQTSASCGTSGTCVKLNASGLTAYDGATPQFAVDAATGTATAGSGTVTLDADGIHIPLYQGDDDIWDPYGEDLAYRFSSPVWGNSTTLDAGLAGSEELTLGSPNTYVAQVNVGVNGPSVVSSTTLTYTAGLHAAMDNGLFAPDAGVLARVTYTGTTYEAILTLSASDNVSGGTSEIRMVTESVLPYPSSGAVQLGSTSYRWGGFYATSADLSGDLAVGGNVASHLIPYSTNTYNLGSSTNRWNEIWMDRSHETTVAHAPVVINGTGQLLVKSNGLHALTSCGPGTAVKSINTQYGIVIGVTCGAL
jgi:hypothetical protein